MTDANGDQLVGSPTRTAFVYTFNRNDLTAGPLWQSEVAIRRDCPTCGDGTISSGTFANGVLYYAGGGNSDAGGIGHGGSVTAFNPATGAVIWKHETNSPILGSIIEDDGMIFDGQGSVIEALDSTTGASLWTYNLGAGTYGAPAVANGTLTGGAQRRLLRVRPTRDAARATTTRPQLPGRLHLSRHREPPHRGR